MPGTILTIELLAAAALWGWWTWNNPKRAFFGLPILLPAYVVRTSLGPIPTTALELIILATCAAWFMRRGRDGIRDARSALRPWRIPAYLWLAAGLLAVIVSPVELQALGLFRAYFIEPLLIFVIGADLIRAWDDKRRLARSFAVITILLGAWAVVQYATGWGVPHPWDAWPGRRATGPFPFPNALALFVTPVAALAFADLLHRLYGRPGGSPVQDNNESLLGTWTAVATAVAGLTAILLAQSDGGLVALLAAAFVALVLNKRTRKIALGLALAGLIALFTIAPLKTRVTEMVTFQEWSGKVRTVIWKESLTMLTDVSTPAGIARPIFGAGLAAYPIAILPYHKATWMEVFQYPHNIALNLWSETGLVGIIAFGWILLVWFKNGKRAIVLPVIAAIVIHGLVDVPYFKNDLAVAFWMIVLVTAEGASEKRGETRDPLQIN